MKILTGKPLAQAVSLLNSITLRDITAQHKLAEISASQAEYLIDDRKVEGICRGNRSLRYLRALVSDIRIPAPRGQFEPCWLNQQAAVIRFHGEQLSA